MDKTKIEWADATWNPVDGCSPVSEGCANCYAANIAKRFWGDRKFSDIMFHVDRFDLPLAWKKPRRIFVCSTGDLFHEDVNFSFIAYIWDTFFDSHPGLPAEILTRQRNHIFIILTKRIENANIFSEWMRVNRSRQTWYPHVWLGVTVENQKRADERIPILLQIPAAVRFVSVEPMLGPVDLSWPLDHPQRTAVSQLDWVICGAETGQKARPMALDWARDLRDQCKAAGIPFFFKKAGNRIETPPDLMVREWPT